MRALLGLLVLTVVFGASFDEITWRIQELLCGFVNMLKDIFPMILLAAFVLAAVVYGIAQMLPQEIKARAQSWAWHSIVFTIVAAILFYVLPFIIQAFMPEWDIEYLCG
ncbi:MAG: hypothetical protein GXN92_01775 [Candidatus Micrarchaeota archaeon]|nr:hypothetical protein [Candidatus Micrarchaeota archaeon]